MPVIEEVEGFEEPQPGVLVGGQPSPDALRQVAARGVQVVVDLRDAHEDRGFDERRVVEDLGMLYVHLPITGASDLDSDRARALDEALAHGDALVHCGSGNRVGALFAMRARLVQGLDATEALEVGRQHGLAGLAPEVEAELRRG